MKKITLKYLRSLKFKSFDCFIVLIILIGMRFKFINRILNYNKFKSKFVEK